MSLTPSSAPTRQCGDCAMCCHLGEIPGVKPYNEWCMHCSTRAGCDIYPSRPNPCRQFYCHYLLSDVDEAWAPMRCGMVVAAYSNPPRMTVLVDPERPLVWREAPYFAQLRLWAQSGAVTVMVGDMAYSITPSGAEALGTLGEGFTLITLEETTASGATRYRSKRVSIEEAETLGIAPLTPRGF